jgi:prevent-host-death family protein
MERATAGEEITVTRRGKPTVRVVAHQPELSVSAE